MNLAKSVVHEIHKKSRTKLMNLSIMKCKRAGAAFFIFVSFVFFVDYSRFSR